MNNRKHASRVWGRGLLVSMTLGLALVGSAANYRGIEFSTSKTDIRPGEWNSQYKQVKAKAAAENAPMVVFWGNLGCGYCEALEDQMRKEFFREFQRESGCYFVFAVDGVSGAQAQSSAAKSFARDGSGSFPYIGFYWKKENGTVVTHKGHGREGEMGVGGKNVGYQFMNWIKKWMGGWTPVKGGQFFLESEGEEEGPGNRYEVEPGAKAVTVTLKRKASAVSSEAEDVVVVKKSGVVVSSTGVDWYPDDSCQEVELDLSRAGVKGGDVLTMEVNGKAATITCVDRPVSAANPLWEGERTAPASVALQTARALTAGAAKPELQFGEWTMSLAQAKALAKAKGGRVLVSVQGSLWCPDCANTDRNFLDLKDEGGKNYFCQWAAEKKVALVSMDVPKLNGKGGADGVLASFEATEAKIPCLWSREGMKTTLARASEKDSGAEPELLQEVFRSGLGYQSRKGISEADAQRVLKANWEFISKDITQGGCHEKTDTWLNRTGVPIFVLLDADGQVVARFTDFAAKSPMKADQEKRENYMKRFDEMLAIADSKANGDVEAREIGNNAVSKATAIPLVANGGETNGCISAADRRDVFYLQGMNGNLKEKVQVLGDLSDKTEVTVMLVTADGFKQVRTGTGATTYKWEFAPIVSKSGKLGDGIELSQEIRERGDYFVVVSGNWDSLADSKDQTFHPFKVSASIESLQPVESVSTANAPAGSTKIDVMLENGVTYRLTGLSDSDIPADLERQEGTEAVYLYKGPTGPCQLTLAGEGGAISYQKWNPGCVGFEPDYVTLPKKNTTKKGVSVTRKENEGIDIAFRRLRGYSGDVTVRVSLNKDLTTFYYDYVNPQVGTKESPRFKINNSDSFMSNTNLVEIKWADGAELAGCVSKISVTMRETESQKVQSFFGDGQVVFDLTVIAQTEAGATTIDNGRFTVKFTENQKPKPGTIAFTQADRRFAKAQTVYARASDAVGFCLERKTYDENPVYGTVKKSVSSVELLPGNVVASNWFDSATGEIGWDNHDRDARWLLATNLPPAGKSVTMTFKAKTSGLKVDSAQKQLTIVSVADDAPCFEEEAKSFTLYRYVAFSNHVAVAGKTAGKLVFKKLSGSLPKGIGVKYDAAAGDMLIAGVPTAKTAKGGRSTYTAFYQVVEQRPTEKKNKTKDVEGLVVMLELTVIDPAVAGTGPEGKPLNAACVKTKTLASIPFVDTEDIALWSGDGVIPSRRLAGLLTLTLPVTGKASAKYVDEEGTLSFSSKSWACPSGVEGLLDDGVLRAHLTCTKKGYGEYYLDVEVDPEGNVEIDFCSANNEYHQSVPASTQWSLQNRADDYRGYYTASLCDATLVEPEKFDGFAPRGNGYLTFKLAVDKKVTSKSAVATGKMTWAGVLPTGAKVSGSSVLFDRGECAWLPYFANSKSDHLYGVAQIKRGVEASVQADDGRQDCYKSVTAPVVSEEDGESGELVPQYDVPTFWSHSTLTSTNALDWSFGCDLRGSYYDTTFKHLKLDCCCEEFHNTTNMTLRILPAVASEQYGRLGPSATDGVIEVLVTVGQKGIALKSKTGNPQKVKLSFKPSTGVATGSFTLPVENGKARSASFAGVVVLGWGDGCGACGEQATVPFMSGAWHFSDKAFYTVLSRGKEVGKSATVPRGEQIVLTGAQPE